MKHSHKLQKQRSEEEQSKARPLTQQTPRQHRLAPPLLLNSQQQLEGNQTNNRNMMKIQSVENVVLISKQEIYSLITSRRLDMLCPNNLKTFLTFFCLFSFFRKSMDEPELFLQKNLNASGRPGKVIFQMLGGSSEFPFL